jgi:hypothetical protein
VPSFRNEHLNVQEKPPNHVLESNILLNRGNPHLSYRATGSTLGGVFLEMDGGFPIRRSVMNPQKNMSVSRSVGRKRQPSAINSLIRISVVSSMLTTESDGKEVNNGK